MATAAEAIGDRLTVLNLFGHAHDGAAAGWRIADNRSGGQRAWRERRRGL
jgi:hypothetical protein